LPAVPETLNPWGVSKAGPLTARGIASRLSRRILNISFRCPSFDLSIWFTVLFSCPPLAGLSCILSYNRHKGEPTEQAAVLSGKGFDWNF
jgi:hypothetical protein